MTSLNFFHILLQGIFEYFVFNIWFQIEILKIKSILDRKTIEYYVRFFRVLRSPAKCFVKSFKVQTRQRVWFKSHCYLDIFVGEKSIYDTRRFYYILFTWYCSVKYRYPKYDSSQRLIYLNRIESTPLI